MHPFHRFPIALSLIALVLVIATHPAWAATHDVDVLNNFFSPNDLTIQTGDTVRWTNNSGLHDVTADNGSFASQTGTEFTFEQTFNTPGVVFYHCAVHSTAGADINTSMNGRITVEGTAATGPNLALQSVNAPAGAVETGEMIEIGSTVQNVGDAESTTYTITFYASADQAISAADTALGTRNRAALAAGVTDEQTDFLLLPGDLAAGDYFIGAILDADETDTGNHTAVDATALTINDDIPFQATPGLNDAWYNPATSGQGLQIFVLEGIGVAVAGWFTFDTVPPPDGVTANLGAPDQRWLLLQGTYADDTLTMDAFSTTGGVFDAADPPAMTGEEAVGSMTVVFSDCLNAMASYALPGLGLSGDIPLQRISDANLELCQLLSAAAQTEKRQQGVSR